MAKQDIDIEGSEIVDDNGSEPRVYELGFHLDPELPSEEVKSAYEAVRGLIAEKGTIVAEGEPQTVQLAYTISRQETSGRRDFNSAHFCWIVYETPAESHTEILTAANADKRIIRFIDLITTKDAARHSSELRELSMKAPEQDKEPEEVMGAELDAAIEHATV
jgi:ribosomal protein S6